MGVTQPDPSDLGARVSELERIVRDLSTGAGLRNASMKDGTTRVTDTNNNPRVIMGVLPDGTYGFEVRDADGRATLKVNDVGLTEPVINLPYREAANPVDVSSGSFTLAWETSLGAITHDSLRWASLIATDSGTTAEAELRTTGGLVSGLQQVPPLNASSRSVWSWRPPLVPEKRTDRFLVQLWVRVAAGGGSVHAYPPDVLFMANGADIGATFNGL